MRPIWIIDDDEDLRSILVYVLKHEGYAVSSFARASEALIALGCMLEVNFPALIICDNLMPEMDGPTFIRIFRELYGDQVPVALCSGLGRSEVPLPAKTIEMAKPVDLDRLLEMAKLSYAQPGENFVS